MIKKLILSVILLAGGTYTAAAAEAVKPAPIVEREIAFRSDTLTLSGTLTLPAAKGSYPVAVILSGTGPQNRDGDMAGHKMFKEISDYLVGQGIGVFRFDDRGVGKSGGRYDTATTADFATDALAALHAVKGVKGVAADKVGFIGHSEGGAAMSIAASQSSDVRFMVSMAGLCADGVSALIRQNEDLVNGYEMPEHDKVRYNTVNNLMFRIAHRYAQSDLLAQKLQEGYDAWHRMDSIYVAALGIEHDHFRFPIWRYINEAQSPWYRFHVSYDPARYLKSVKVPVLALAGGRDVMVNAKLHLGGWRRYLPEGADVTEVELPELNHLFLPCRTGMPGEYASIKAPVSPEALAKIAEWIHLKTR